MSRVNLYNCPKFVFKELNLWMFVFVRPCPESPGQDNRSATGTSASDSIRRGETLSDQELELRKRLTIVDQGLGTVDLGLGQIAP